MAPRARVQKRLYYKIGEACKALGIQPYVLRYWETEFPALSPSKSRSGQRVYSEKELEVIRRIKELLYDEGYTIAGAKKKLESELAGGGVGENSLPEAAPPAPQSPRPSADGAEPENVGGPASSPTRSPGRPLKSPANGQGAGAPASTPWGSAGDPGLTAIAPAGQPSEAVSSWLDTRAAQRIQRLRTGIQQALQEAREILALLDS